MCRFFQFLCLKKHLIELENQQPIMNVKQSVLIFILLSATGATGQVVAKYRCFVDWIPKCSDCSSEVRHVGLHVKTDDGNEYFIENLGSGTDIYDTRSISCFFPPALTNGGSLLVTLPSTIWKQLVVLVTRCTIQTRTIVMMHAIGCWSKLETGSANGILKAVARISPISVRQITP